MTIVIRELKQTCWASPSQWEGMTLDNRPIYIRYRWGELSVRVGPLGGTVSDALHSEPIFDAEAGEKMGGMISLEEACEAADLVVEK